MQIFIYEKDGRYGADYSRDFCERMGKIVEIKSGESAAELERIMADPGPYAGPRVAGLAERAWRDVVAKAKIGFSYRDAWRLPVRERLKTAWQIARGKS
jgi:hypothetical protein